MRLLIIEDEPDLLSGLSRALRRTGYSVDTAADGDDGLFRALEIDYDAIVLDVMLPHLDGWAVLARLREKKSTPVIMLTARDATRDRVRGFDTGADDYLVKPFELDELLARLRALIRRSAGRATPALEIGALKIDTVARRVTLGGSEVPLKAREYDVLEYLALHRGQVITRTTLYEHLYDESGDTLSNLMDVLIYNLRSKLGRDLITTRRGHGYCIP
ncbi:response regulator transcription factor [Prosthecobacter vanneervenii]|uniref:Two-component system OmpR family response regulator n=1 Tax=Prosthecobacter vanneervenii TaxID=48466 RepID=A0A7W7YFI8_9BACT|nr:response regulator transcription factor [Prosthecobacter vanneervenii]MBB5035236.1 two-component system OmpR family response regulator [Prosthecobacter vanneervenii]